MGTPQTPSGAAAPEPCSEKLAHRVNQTLQTKNRQGIPGTFAEKVPGTGQELAWRLIHQTHMQLPITLASTFTYTYVPAKSGKT